MDYEARVSMAVQHFWAIRNKQSAQQGSTTGKKDYGSRSAVTGAKQLDGFAQLLSDIIREAGLPEHTIYTKRDETFLPGFFRPTKQWDLVAVASDQLLASIEFKSHIGPSFGNNFNNRVEEALGSASDLWTAYREGAFKPSQKPWLGWLMLLEDAPKSRSAVRVKEKHFKVFEEFRGASYIKRYELFCERLVRERLYDATCLLLTDKDGGPGGDYLEPNPELDFRTFATSLTAHVMAFVKMRK
ncbi:MAG: PaeR7I family type II restriction endonuclease [Anaerolineae bacterium]|nr:PaeR7I family type II restriction endonuclease [Anaerolineae bacterium]